jgi:hypothetical protein
MERETGKFLVWEEFGRKMKRLYLFYDVTALLWRVGRSKYKKSR